MSYAECPLRSDQRPKSKYPHRPALPGRDRRGLNPTTPRRATLLKAGREPDGLVVALALDGVRQHGVCLIEPRLLRDGLRRARMFVRVAVLGQATVGRSDHPQAGVRADLQQVIECGLECHGF